MASFLILADDTLETYASRHLDRTVGGDRELTAHSTSLTRHSKPDTLFASRVFRGLKWSPLRR